YKAVPESICRYTKRAGVILRGDLLHDIGISRARMNERSTQRFKELAVFRAPGSKLCNLTGATRHNVLVAFPATLRVIRRPKSVLNAFSFLEDEPVIVERAERNDRVFVQGLEIWSLVSEAVGQIVKSGGRFGGVAPSLSKGRTIFIFHHAVMTES